MTSEWTVTRTLAPLVRRHAALVGALVVLGAGAALSEGVGLGLFIPLLQSLQGGHAPALDGRLGALLEAPFARLDPSLRLRAVLGTLFALLVVRNLLVLAHGVLAGRLTSRTAHELRTAAVTRLLEVEERWLERRDTGSWLNLLETQTWETAAALGTLVGLATRVCKIAVFALALIAISWRLTVAVGLVLALVSTGVRLLARRVDAVGRAETHAWEAMAQRLVETLRTLRTIHVFGRERHEAERVAAVSDAERRTFQRLQTLQAIVPPASEFLVAALMLVVLAITLDDPARLPGALTFLLVLYRLHPQVQHFDAGRVGLAAAAAPATAVMSLLDPRDKPLVRSGTRPFTRLERSIAFRDVTVAYDADGPRALDGVSFEIRAGARTAIVGPSGAGKSTLVRLLVRVLEPTAGTIEVDGVPLDAIDLAAWRARVAVVGQDLPLCDATVAENIAYGRDAAASDAEIRAAACRADADAFIHALPERYATRLGEGGVRLSGGERQRIALARALLRDPAILILDEATNAVDDVSTALILRTLADLGRDRTVIVVSHRRTMIEHADEVVVLERGRVHAAGATTRVLGGGGLVARLFGLGRAASGGAR